MSMSDRGELAARVYRRCHLSGHFVLRSGATSDEYFDKYLLESDPPLLRRVVEAMADLVPAGTEIVAGLELGGVPLATALSLHTGLPARFVRKEPKSYGTCRLAEGGEVEGARLLVVEDVVTSGGQLLASCRDLRERGAQLVGALCVIDREAGATDNLRMQEIELWSLFTASELEAAAG